MGYWCLLLAVGVRSSCNRSTSYRCGQGLRYSLSLSCRVRRHWLENRVIYSNYRLQDERIQHPKHTVVHASNKLTHSSHCNMHFSE